MRQSISAVSDVCGDTVTSGFAPSHDQSRLPGRFVGLFSINLSGPCSYSQQSEASQPKQVLCSSRRQVAAIQPRPSEIVSAIPKVRRGLHQFFSDVVGKGSLRTAASAHRAASQASLSALARQWRCAPAAVQCGAPTEKRLTLRINWMVVPLWTRLLQAMAISCN